jgi:hypothetical protein
MDAWLAAGAIDEHDRPQIALRLRESFLREGELLTFGEFSHGP